MVMAMGVLTACGEEAPKPVTGYVASVGAADFFLNPRVDYETQKAAGFQPRPTLPPWPLALPLDWGADPYSDANWMFTLQSWGMIDPILQRYFDTGDTVLLDEAFAFVRDWHRYHIVEERRASHAWYDMATGLRAEKLAVLLDRFKSGELALNDADARMLLKLVDSHARRLQVAKFISMGNHGLFQVFGLRLLCEIASERKACKGAREFAEKKFSEILTEQFSPQAVHTENSPFYHFFTLRLLERLRAAERFPDPRTKDLLVAANRLGPWFVFPNGDISRIGDSSGRGEPLDVAPGEGILLGDFTKSGYAIARDPDSMIFATSTDHTNSHKHADDLSFELFEFGRFVFIDSGPFAYRRDPMRTYVMSAAAHNTIGLEGVEIGPRDLDPAQSGLDGMGLDGDTVAITGRAVRPGLFTQRREIRYQPGRSLMIRDEVSADEDRIFVSSLLLAPDLEPALDRTGFSADLGDGHTLRADLVESDCRLDSVRGQSDPPLGWTTRSYMDMEPATVVRALCTGQSRTITWRIAFDLGAGEL